MNRLAYFQGYMNKTAKSEQASLSTQAGPGSLSGLAEWVTAGMKPGVKITPPSVASMQERAIKHAFNVNRMQKLKASAPTKTMGLQMPKARNPSLAGLTGGAIGAASTIKKNNRTYKTLTTKGTTPATPQEVAAYRANKK